MICSQCCVWPSPLTFVAPPNFLRVSIIPSARIPIIASAVVEPISPVENPTSDAVAVLGDLVPVAPPFESVEARRRADVDSPVGEDVKGQPERRSHKYGQL